MEKQQELFPKIIYCIDASSLINLKPYRKDIFPTIWDKLDKMAKNGELISHLEVYKELEAGGDTIYRWCKSNKRMFKDVDECQIRKLQEVKNRFDKTYWENEINKTAPWADPWIIVLGICAEAIIVTDEKNAQNRIPAIASIFGIKCLELLDFFKEIGIKY